MAFKAQIESEKHKYSFSASDKMMHRHWTSHRLMLLQ